MNTFDPIKKKKPPRISIINGTRRYQVDKTKLNAVLKQSCYSREQLADQIPLNVRTFQRRLYETGFTRYEIVGICYTLKVRLIDILTTKEFTNKKTQEEFAHIPWVFKEVE